MTLKDAIGMLFIGVGATVGTVAYRLLGIKWYVGAGIVLSIGVLLIWSAARDKKIRALMSDVYDDWGDGHYFSGGNATDDVDVGSDFGGD